MHELSIAARFSDRLALLAGGKLHAVGKPADVLTERALQDVYGVEAQIKQGDFGLEVVPVRPVNSQPKAREQAGSNPDH